MGNSKPLFYIGLMSGTSMDGVDCALVSIQAGQITLIDYLTLDISLELKSKILALCTDGSNQISALGQLDIELARLFSQAVLKILKQNQMHPDQISAIGSHGQTIRHAPPKPGSPFPFTLQISDPNTIAELTGITTVADFRRRDIAAGGQGAPLVPAFHREIFKSNQIDRIILNIGGISNITLLKQGTNQIIGFDTGPGNVLMDLWIQQKQGKAYDQYGLWSATGQCNNELLRLFLEEQYFQLPPPKSTGRELFNSLWLKQKLQIFNQPINDEDVQATLLEFTTTSISDSITGGTTLVGEVIICGGGAYNNEIVSSLTLKLPQFRVLTSKALGFDADSIEALAFAWFAHQTMTKQPVDLTHITGSSHPSILGGIYYST